MIGAVIVGELPRQIEQLIAERQRLGLDRHDEVWEGTYHMVPAAHNRHGNIAAQLVALIAGPCQRLDLTFTVEFNLGNDAQDFRVPDFGVYEGPPDRVYAPTALIVGEVLSPDDETYDKIPFYRGHGVREMWVVDPSRRRIDVHHLDRGTVDGISNVLMVDCAELAGRVRWPAVD